MPHPRARRTATIGALVAAVSVTMVAGVWPALGVAAAAERPGAGKPGGGSSQAPGQVEQQSAPVVGPATTASAPLVAGAATRKTPTSAAPAPAQVAPKAEAPGQTKKAPTTTGSATGSGTGAATVTAPTATGSGTTASSDTTAPASATGKDGAPGKTGADKTGPGAGSSVVGPPTRVSAPAPASTGNGSDKGGRPGRVAAQQGASAAGASPDRGNGAAQEPGQKDARAAAPAFGPQPIRVGPVIPVRAVATPAKVGLEARPPVSVLSLGEITLPAHAKRVPRFGPSTTARVPAAGMTALRPRGAQSPASPKTGPKIGAETATPVVRGPESLPITLTTALPGLAVGTADAVAETPGLPLGIAAVVVLFLLVQNRIDRRDPKLALARVEEDEPLHFTPRADVVHLRLVQAA